MDTVRALMVCLVLSASRAAAVPGQWPLPNSRTPLVADLHADGKLRVLTSPGGRETC